MSSASKNVRRSYRLPQPLTRLLSLPSRVRSDLTRFFSVGRWGERIAARHLQRAGLVLLKRNWRDAALEADLIFQDKRTIVLTEVKTRRAYLKRDYPGRNAITPKKALHLERLARSFLRNNGPFCRRYGIRGYRIDLVEIYYEPIFGALRRAKAIEWTIRASVSKIETYD